MPSSISYTISFSSPLSTHFTHFLPDYHFTLSTRRVFFLPFFLLTSIFLLWPHYNLRYCRIIRRFIQIKIFTFNRDMYFYLGYFSQNFFHKHFRRYKLSHSDRYSFLYHFTLFDTKASLLLPSHAINHVSLLVKITIEHRSSSHARREQSPTRGLYFPS